ncbi:MAG: hypothetical protein QM784_30775 [Polyangiaceae bacterium]
MRQVELPGASKTPRPEIEYRELTVDWQGNLPMLSRVRLENASLDGNAGRYTDGPVQLGLFGGRHQSHASARGQPRMEPLRRHLPGPTEWARFALGETFATAKWSVSYRDGDDGPVAVLGFTAVDVSELLSRVSNAPVPDALAKARADGVLTAQLDPATLKVLGKVTARLTGFVPPHPPELKGYAFKDTTRLDVTFSGDPLLNVAELPVIQLVNGDIALLGTGRVERTSAGAKIRADLSTHLDCVTIAKGFAASEVGGALGE